MGIKTNFVVFAGLIVCSCLVAAGEENTVGKSHTIRKNVTAAKLNISPEGQTCFDCHAGSTPVLVQQWRTSGHAKQGIDCYTCHKANADDPAAFDHYGQKIAVIVTPKYCARCHKAEVDQYEHSRHARATQFIGSLDNVLGEVVEVPPPCRVNAGNATAVT